MFPIASLTTPHSHAGIPARRLLAHAVVVRLLLGWLLSFSLVAGLSAQVDESAPGSRSYYIDPVNGSDSANDGTFARPWKSFRNLSTYDGASLPPRKAALAAGDCVYVMDGVITDVNYVYGTTGIAAVAYFRAAWDGCRGEQGKPIRIKAYPGTRPILDAQYRGYGMMLDGCDYWDVSGLTIRNAIPTIRETDGRTTCPEGGALYLVGGSHIKIHDLDINDTKGVPGQNIGSFVAKSVLDLEFYNNRLNSAKELLYSAGKVERDGGNVYLYAIDGPSKNGTLARIFHSDETGTGNHVYRHNEFSFSTSVAGEGDGLGFKHGNRDLTKSVAIYGNTFRNCRAVAILTSTPNTHCYFNVMTGCGIGIASSSLGGGPGGGTYLVNQTFENNTIYDTQPNPVGEDSVTGYWFGNQEEVSPANPALERQKITFRKNILVDLRSGTVDMVTINSYLSDAEYNALKGEFTLTNNCYYAPNGTARFSIAGSTTFGSLGAFYTNFALWQSTMGYDAGSLSGQNPSFVAAAQGDFHLASQTPCPDAGAFPRNPADTAAPGTPSGLKVFSNDSTSLFIRWSEPASWTDVAGFRVYRNGTLVRDTVTTGFLDTNLGGRTDHAYTVLAYDRAGNVSPVSAAATLAGGASYVKPLQFSPTILMNAEDGSPSWSDADGGTTRVAEEVFEGAKSFKMSVTQGSDGWGMWGGRKFLTPIRKGGVVHVQFSAYMPSTFSWQASPFLKFARLHVVDAAGNNVGYNDMYIHNASDGDVDGSIWHHSEYASTGPWNIDTGEVMRKGEWTTFEMQIVFDDVSAASGGSGRIRIWRYKSGVGMVLVYENRNQNTLGAADGYCDGFLLFTYWNGNAPQTQHCYVDRVVIETDLTKLVETDSSGNKIIGGVATTVSPNAAPVVSAASAVPVVGASTTVTATATDDGGEAGLSYTWSSTGPAAVVFAPNGTNAAKSATATFSRAGSYTFTVTARDAGGLTATRNVAVTVNDALPLITTQPVNRVVNAGSSTSFSVAATAPFAITYQWRKNGVAISGATGASLAFASAAVGDTAAYDVVVSTSAGSVTSNLVTLTVTRTFAAWATGYALPAGRNGQADDADGDGMNNLLEYALGLDPTSIALGLRPSVAKENGQIVYRFTRSRAVSGVTLQTLVSSDLVNWTPGPALVVESSTAATETCTAVLPAGEARRFLRLEATGP